MHDPNTNTASEDSQPPQDSRARIQALLDRMDVDERHDRGASLQEQRKAWQHAWYLRYVVGPFMAGQLFDLWQFILARVDDLLWQWAQKTPPPTSTISEPATTVDPRKALRQELEKKKSNPTPPA